jgi:hypothetical protein
MPKSCLQHDCVDAAIACCAGRSRPVFEAARLHADMKRLLSNEHHAGDDKLPERRRRTRPVPPKQSDRISHAANDKCGPCPRCWLYRKSDGRQAQPSYLVSCV